jgi:nucleoside-diphosphate-sugar epimerase
MEKVLLIGGCGYIGTRLYQTLSHQGYEVASVDLEWFGKHAAMPNWNTDFATLTQPYLLQFPTIVLLAGHSSVKMCENNLKSTFSNNVANFIDLLPKLRPEQKFIYASSSSIYGGLDNQSMPESFPSYRALNYYDLSKYEIDSYAKLSSHVQYYGLRFGTVNGYSLNFRDDIMLNAMFKSSKTNGFVSMSNPDIFRPILGISDLCNAVLRIMREGSFDKRGVYNLASFTLTVKDIATKAADILGVPLVTNPDRPNAYNFGIDTKKFQEAFGFQFNETIESILHEIGRGQGQITYTNRNLSMKYGT